jgi:hypothetical protein
VEAPPEAPTNPQPVDSKSGLKIKLNLKRLREVQAESESFSLVVSSDATLSVTVTTFHFGHFLDYKNYGDRRQ